MAAFVRAMHSAWCLENVLQSCLRAGLVDGETFATDASVIEADAMRRTEGKEPPDDWDDPGKVSRPVREYLDTLDKAAGLALNGETPSLPKALSLTDPSAALHQQKVQSKIKAYGTNYLIDTKAAIILDVEPSPARWTAEVAATRTMIDRTANRFGLTPEQLAADTAYGSGGMLAWLIERGIEPHIPLLDRADQTGGMFTHRDFAFDRERNIFVCPGGKLALHLRARQRHSDVSRPEGRLRLLPAQGPMHERGFPGFVRQRA